MRSADRPWTARPMQVTRIGMTMYGRRGFGHAGPSAWNAPPNYLRTSAHLRLLLDAISNIATSLLQSSFIVFFS